MEAVTQAPQHPAKYTASVLDAIVEVLSAQHIEGDILDPMAGTGRIHELRTRSDDVWVTWGVELEPEWAAMHPCTFTGDATRLPAEWSGKFAAVVTSVPYGNRMADAYAGDAKGSRRHTYRIALGRALTGGSAAGMQWGVEYRDTMHKILVEIHRVLEDGGLFVLNVKDHVRGGQLQGVPEWYSTVALSLGFQPVDVIGVDVPGNRHGANYELRAECEYLLVYRKAAA